MPWVDKCKDLPFDLIVRSGIEVARAYDFWMKEPETLAWIDSFLPKSVFWDIGANIGVFSLYANSKGNDVFAFEPEKRNVQRIKENLAINSNTIQFFDYALSDTDGKSVFFVPEIGTGRSGAQINAPIYNGDEFLIRESYDVEAYKIDTLVEKLGVIPNYIKIDVDGIEWRILRGGKETLKRPEVRSVLIEVNRDHIKIENFMLWLGFTSWNKFNTQDFNRRAFEPEHNRIYVRT
jgi:FkbM family methyltransferase